MSRPPPGCKVVKDGCDEFVVVESNNITDCFTGLSIQEVRTRSRIRSRVENYLTRWSREQLGLVAAMENGAGAGGPGGEGPGEVEYNPLLDFRLMEMLFGGNYGRAMPLAADVPAPILETLTPGRSVALSSIGSPAGAGVNTDAGAGMNVDAGAGMNVDAGAGMNVDTVAGLTIDAGAGMNIDTGAGRNVDAGAGRTIATVAGMDSAAFSLSSSTETPVNGTVFEKPRVDATVIPGTAPTGKTVTFPGFKFPFGLGMPGPVIFPTGASNTDIQGQSLFKSESGDFLRMLALLKLFS